MSERDEKILIIEDELPIQRFLTVLLTGHGYQVKSCETGQSGINEIANWQPNLVLLDLGLPDMDGLEVTQMVREWSNVPIIVVSAKGEEDNKVQALDSGANDYLTKPFGSGEFMARVRVALRSSQPSAPVTETQTLTFGDIEMDLLKRRVTRNGELLHLTPTEYKILLLMAKNMDKVLTHRQILMDVWGPAYIDHSQYVRVHMAQLRHKIERTPAQPQFIMTEMGIGYRLLSGEK